MTTTGKEVQLIELSAITFQAVKAAQDALARWIVPNSGIEDKTVLNELIGILDDQKLVRAMKAIEPVELIKLWPSSANIARTQYFEKTCVLEVEFKNGNIYQYTGFPLKFWEELIHTASIGSFINQRIKGHFEYAKIN